MAPCTQTNVGGKRTTTLSASSNYKGQLLTLTSTSTLFGRRTAFGTFSQRVELGGKLLYELTYNSVQDGRAPAGFHPQRPHWGGWRSATHHRFAARVMSF